MTMYDHDHVRHLQVLSGLIVCTPEIWEIWQIGLERFRPDVCYAGGFCSGYIMSAESEHSTVGATIGSEHIHTYIIRSILRT